MTEHEVIAGILEREGGYSDRAADKGGPTAFGITKTTFESYIGRSVTLEEFKARCTVAVATTIYELRYLPPWTWIEDPRLRVLLIDWGVNSGQDQPTRALQKAVGVTVDGRLGPATRSATVSLLNAGKGRELFAEVLRLRMQFYVKLAKSDTAIRLAMEVNPTLQIHNLAGWLNRCAEFF